MKKANKIVLGILFWTWQLTWGLLMTSIGLVTALVCLAIGGKAYKNGLSFVVEIGDDWGGISLGAVTFTGAYSKTANLDWFEHLRRHEFGHSVQNLIFGPLFPFVIGLPSLIRAWYHTRFPDKPHQDYDYIWFEHTASKWGTSWINKIEGQNVLYHYVREKRQFDKNKL